MSRKATSKARESEIDITWMDYVDYVCRQSESDIFFLIVYGPIGAKAKPKLLAFAIIDVNKP